MSAPLSGDPAELRRLELARVELRHPAIQTSLWLCQGDLLETGDVEIRLVVQLTVPDRDTGQMAHVRHGFVVPADVNLVDFAMAAISRAWRHELREALHVDGRRLDDPHRDPAGPHADEL